MADHIGDIYYFPFRFWYCLLTLRIIFRIVLEAVDLTRLQEAVMIVTTEEMIIAVILDMMIEVEMMTVVVMTDVMPEMTEVATVAIEEPK